MQAGDLDKRVRIQRKNPDAKDAYGQPTATWEDVAVVWANVRQIAGRERLRVDGVAAELTHTVCVRYRPALMLPAKAAAMRAVYRHPAGDRHFNITAANDLKERHEWIVFDCTEGSVNGE